jgi:hypothetical protein
VDYKTVNSFIHPANQQFLKISAVTKSWITIQSAQPEEPKAVSLSVFHAFSALHSSQKQNCYVNGNAHATTDQQQQQHFHQLAS